MTSGIWRTFDELHYSLLKKKFIYLYKSDFFFLICCFFRLFRSTSDLFLWPQDAHRGLATQDQTRRSLCICASFFKQVNPAWHLLSASLNNNATEENSVKPVALTYLTVVSRTVRAWEVSVCLYPLSLSPLPRFLPLAVFASRESQRALKQQEEGRIKRLANTKDKVAF